jgi:hypothetical protein
MVHEQHESPEQWPQHAGEIIQIPFVRPVFSKRLVNHAVFVTRVEAAPSSLSVVEHVTQTRIKSTRVSSTCMI